MVGYLKGESKSIIFALLKCKTIDDSQSVRFKFIFVRFVGSGVRFMDKAKLTPTLGKISDCFPVKHLSLDAYEDSCEHKLNPRKLARELLRIGGAHKPVCNKYIYL